MDSAGNNHAFTIKLKNAPQPAAPEIEFLPNYCDVTCFNATFRSIHSAKCYATEVKLVRILS